MRRVDVPAAMTRLERLFWLRARINAEIDREIARCTTPGLKPARGVEEAPVRPSRPDLKVVS